MKGYAVLVIVLALLLIRPWSDAQAQGWRSLQNADFPALVQAVRFENGTLDAEHARVWGQWTTRFGAQPPVATFIKCDNTVCPSFRIENLECANKVVGESRCALTVSWRTAFTEAVCGLYIEKQRMDVQVGCPADVRFK